MNNNKTLLIGVAGLARSGKDTIASYLQDEYLFETLSFAAPMKRALATMLGLTTEQLDGAEKEMVLPWLGVSPRELLQTLGTEWGRDRINPYIWLIACRRCLDGLVGRQWVDPKKEKKARVIAINHGFEPDSIDDTGSLGTCVGVVISDVRFENEATFIRERGGLVLHVKRDQAQAVRSHKSEAGMVVQLGDIVIINNGSLNELYAKIDGVMMALVEVS